MSREWVDELPRFSHHLRTPLNELPAGVLAELPWLSDLPEETIWADVLIALGGLADRLRDEDGPYPRCACCSRRAELITPLVPAA